MIISVDLNGITRPEQGVHAEDLSCIKLVAHTLGLVMGRSLRSAHLDLKVPSLVARIANLEVCWDQRASSDTRTSKSTHADQQLQKTV